MTTVLVAPAPRAAALRDGAAGAVSLALGDGSEDEEEGAYSSSAPSFALFSDDLAALAGGGWLGLEAVVVPTGGGSSGAAARRLRRALNKIVRRNGTCAVGDGDALSPQPPPPSLILFKPPTGRLGDAEALRTALASAAAATGLAFRVVGGPGADAEGDGSNALETILSSLSASLAGARVIVGRGGPDLAAVAAAAPPGASLLELATIEPHPAVAAVVAARSAGGPATALASHALWTPHPPGGPIGAHLDWGGDEGERRRYGAWARPDCRVAALHGGDCAAAAARAALVVGGVEKKGEASSSSSSLASVVSAALRGLYVAERVAGVGLA